MAAARNNHKRRRGRGRFAPLFKLLCALAVVVALTMGATVFFRVEQVQVFGNSRYTAQEVIEVSGIQVGDNLFHMNKYQVAGEIRQRLPYVEGVNIVRDYPSTIVITVTECGAAARVMATEEGSAVSEEGEVLTVAGEDWLISVSGKLLEPAPADSTAIPVTGITPILPRAGDMLRLPQAETDKHNALLGLLEQLEALEMMGRVSAIHLESTQVRLRYLERFDVKIALTADFNYKLRVLDAAVTETQGKLGEHISGAFDLTQEDYAAVYSPE